MNERRRIERVESASERPKVGSLAGWLLAPWRGQSRARRSLSLQERIALGPRQTLALVEADGRRLLVATSPEGAPAFYPLDERPRGTGAVRLRTPAPTRARVSW